MTSHYRITAQLDPLSGWQNEAVTNTFHVAEPDDSLGAGLTDIMPVIARFYTTASGTMTAAVGTYLSAALDRGAGKCTLKGYTLDSLDPTQPTGSPDVTSTFTLPAAGSTEDAPNQVAAVLTLDGRGAASASVQVGDQRPKSRRRGRLYLGPLNVTALNRVASGNTKVAQVFWENALEAAEKLQDDLGGVGAIWSVYSRSAATMYGITGVSMDDSLDILRSRKVAPTVRNVRTFAPVPSLALGA